MHTLYNQIQPFSLFALASALARRRAHILLWGHWFVGSPRRAVRPGAILALHLDERPDASTCSAVHAVVSEGAPARLAKCMSSSRTLKLGLGAEGVGHAIESRLDGSINRHVDDTASPWSSWFATGGAGLAALIGGVLVQQDDALVRESLLTPDRQDCPVIQQLSLVGTAGQVTTQPLLGHACTWSSQQAWFTHPPPGHPLQPPRLA
jgi:hypothetical protein